VSAYVITPADRTSFCRCRRAWDFSARARQNLIPRAHPPEARWRQALREGLAVYYFPGMWAWERAIVRPLALQGFERALRKSVDAEGSTNEGHDLDCRLEQGRSLLEAYFEWTVDFDGFTPIRVEADFSVNVADPGRWGSDLVTPGGQEVRFEGRVDMIVMDEDRRYWLVVHRLGESPILDPELLALDEESLSLCWAWEHDALDMKMAGVIYNDLCATPSAPAFARTPMPRSRDDVEGAGRRLGLVASEMAHPDLVLYPSPEVGHCSSCAFRAPCTAINEGLAAEAHLERAYQVRPKEDPQEGRLGGSTWSMGRGAAPPKFGR
jgi:hypothetical protein